MLKVALGDLLRDPPGGKEGRRDVKIGSMRRKDNLALEKGRFKRTRQCLVLRGAIVSIKGMKSLSEGMRNLNIYLGWFGIWSWKREEGVEGGTIRSEEKGQLVWEVIMEQGPINLDLIYTRIACGNMQTETRFPRRSNDPGMLPWML